MNVRLGDAGDRLAAHLKARRQELRLGQAEAARRANVGRMSWYEWENGRRLPRDYNFPGVDSAMNWEPGSVETILSGGEPTPTKAELRNLLIARLAAAEVIHPGLHDEIETKRLELLKRTVEQVPDDKLRDLLDGEWR